MGIAVRGVGLVNTVMNLRASKNGKISSTAEGLSVSKEHFPMDLSLHTKSRYVLH
jgi:hypothetical protein